MASYSAKKLKIISKLFASLEKIAEVSFLKNVTEQQQNIKFSNFFQGESVQKKLGRKGNNLIRATRFKKCRALKLCFVSFMTKIEYYLGLFEKFKR